MIARLTSEITNDITDRGLRTLLAENRAAQRDANDALAAIKAEAEKRAIDAAGGDEKALGANAEARSRALTLALAEDSEYQAILGGVRCAEANNDLLTAEIESRADERRKVEWDIRLRLVDVLDRRGIYSNGHNDEFDRSATEAITRSALRLANDNRTAGTPTSLVEDIPF